MDERTHREMVLALLKALRAQVDALDVLIASIEQKP